MRAHRTDQSPYDGAPGRHRGVGAHHLGGKEDRQRNPQEQAVPESEDEALENPANADIHPASLSIRALAAASLPHEAMLAGKGQLIAATAL
jgi:hypothetical protein